MSKQDEILAIVTQKGPVLPVHVAHDAKISMLFAGAYLSELASSKKVIISNTKVGSSPLYYVKGQEPKLENFTKYLNNTEQAVVTKLKENKILNDQELDPASRVALRQIKDFAIPIKVNLKTGQKLYWKWYMLPNEEAENIIREKINQHIEAEEQPETKPEKQQETKPEKQLETKPEQKPKPDTKQEKRIKEQPVTKKEPSIKKKITIKKKKRVIQKALIEKPKEKVPEFNPETKDALLELAKKHFRKLDIEIINCETIMQNKELDLHVTVSTTIGDLPYFCKIKKKTRSTENDLFATLLSAQKKGLPALYVATGTINKKAKGILLTKAHSIQFLSIKK